jgi:hypothetical protein
MAKGDLSRKSMVKVINNTVGSCSFKGMDDKKYLFPTPKSFRSISLDVIEELYYSSPNFILGGTIIFEDKKVYEFLGIEEGIYKKLLPNDEIKKFLEKDAEEIKKELEEMPQQIKENVAITAKDMKLDSRKKAKAIKEATGLDIEEDEE